MSDALRKENIRVAAFYVPGILAVVIASMSVMRDILRDAYLKPYFQPGAIRRDKRSGPCFRCSWCSSLPGWFFGS